MTSTGRPVRFANAGAFRAWLRMKHRTATSLLVRIAKSGTPGLTYGPALDQALCYGWIDGVRRRIDSTSFSIRFSPRKPRSIWSRINVRHAERLIRARRMAKAGLEAFGAREAARTGIYSFEKPPSELPRAYRARLRANPRAFRYFNDEAPWYRRTAAHWILSAKRPETRIKRLEALISCSARGERIPPLRRP